MKFKKIFALLATMLVLIATNGIAAEQHSGQNSNQLSPERQKIALIAAFSASGDIDRLKQVLVEGLEAGLTVNQIKEVLIHVHAYAGFPRALNAINAFIVVMDEREAAGIEDVHGPEASPVEMDNRYQRGYDNLAKLRDPNHVPGQPSSSSRPRYENFTPIIEVFLKEHLFAPLFSRDVLDYLSRQIATVGILSNLPNTNAQLRSHINLAMVQGASEEQMRHLFTMMGTYLGRERGDNALTILQELIDSR
jgi:alkylhydroperoxidase/carboxymuconolactone decarboxylase family protein YurZ